MGEALFKGGSVPINRKINGKSLATDIVLSAIDVGASALGHIHADTEINANNGINSATLRDILTKYTVKKTDRDNRDQLTNPNYPQPYETTVSNNLSTAIGLPGGWWHIKYFKHDDNNGFGAQLAISLDSVNRMFFRTSTGTTWNKWTELYHSDNASAVTSRGIIIGSYTGNYIYDYKTGYVSGDEVRLINLGFTPRAVLVVSENGSTHYNEGHAYHYGGLAMPGKPVITRNEVPVLTIETNGFNVYYKSGGDNWLSYAWTNVGEKNYYYIAIV